MEVVLPGETDATVDLERALHRPTIDLSQAGLRDRGGARRLAQAMIEAVGRVPDEGAGRLDLGCHLGGHVLDRLERADLPPELLAHLGVLDRHLECARRPAEAVRGDADGAEIEEAGEEPSAVALPAEERVAPDHDVAQLDLAHPAREVDRLRGPEPYAARRRLDQEE